MQSSNFDQHHHQYNYVRVLKAFWRRKWVTVIFLLSCVLVLLFILTRESSPAKSVEDDTNDFSEELYQQVLQKWYNFTDGGRWYNDHELSPTNSESWESYLTDIRQNWIVSEYNPNESYHLNDPELADTSMGQTQAIRDVLNDKKNGFFIECGAYDGETRSNTLFFERFLGWTGLLIEADPINFSKMIQKNRNALLSPTCLSIHSYPVMASFLMANNIGRLHEEVNTTGDTLINSLDIAHTGNHIKVQCFPFAHYLAALKIQTVDYFSLDIEGNEIDVLETIPFNDIDIKTLSVEYIHNPKGRKYLIDMMDRRGYYVHSFVEHSDNLANDIIFVKRGSR